MLLFGGMIGWLKPTPVPKKVKVKVEEVIEIGIDVNIDKIVDELVARDDFYRFANEGKWCSAYRTIKLLPPDLYENKLDELVRFCIDKQDWRTARRFTLFLKQEVQPGVLAKITRLEESASGKNV